MHGTEVDVFDSLVEKTRCFMHLTAFYVCPLSSLQEEMMMAAVLRPLRQLHRWQWLSALISLLCSMLHVFSQWSLCQHSSKSQMVMV